MRFKVLVLLSILGGCGAQPQRAPAQAAPPQTAASVADTTFAKDASGIPGWVHRGSVTVVAADGRNIFYGVGLANGIKNIGLLRSTADNRARAELNKVFEVFSASLMKDYMNSDGDQNVEQAIKTASKGALQGAEIVDRYVAADGGMYALAALDFDRIKEALAAAEKAGIIKRHTHEVDVDDIFAEHARPAPPKAAPRAEASAAETPVATSSAKSRSDRPLWVDGPDPSYPDQRYLCGVGFAPDRGMAESASFAAISRLFKVQVESVSKDFLGAYTKSGAPPLDVQTAEITNTLRTDKILSGVRVYEVWTDKAANTVYAWSCLERAVASASLREKITNADNETTKHLESAQTSDKRLRVKALASALRSITTREALNGELRLVDADGIGVTSPYSHVDVVQAFDAAVEVLRIGVQVEGAYAEDFQSALIEGLTQRNYKVSEITTTDAGGLDVLIRGTVRMEGDSTERAGKVIYMARPVVTVEVKDVVNAKVLGSCNIPLSIPSAHSKTPC